MWEEGGEIIVKLHEIQEFKFNLKLKLELIYYCKKKKRHLLFSKDLILNCLIKCGFVCA